MSSDRPPQTMTTPTPTVGRVSPQGVTRQDATDQPVADVGLREANPTYGAGWFETTIGEQVTLQRGFDITKATQRDGAIPVVSSGGTNSYHCVSQARGPGVVLGRKGVVGSVYFVRGDYWPHDTTLWVKNFHGNDPLFTYYFFRSRASDLAALDVGSANPTLNRNHVHPIKTLWPPLKEQQGIAALLCLLDDRIALLRETNATLEAIAQALFKSWFVDFDPVRAKQQGLAPEGMDDATAALFPDGFEELERGRVPKGWTLIPLSEAFEINPSRKLKKGETAPYLDMASVSTQGHVVGTQIEREFGSGTKFVNGDTLLARITPCLENGKTAYVDCLPDSQTGWGSTEFVVLRPRPPLPPYYAYLLCRHAAFREFAIQSMSGTSGRQRIQNDVLGRYPVAVPPPALADAFGQVVNGLQSKIAANHAQAQTLSTLRDTLLPRLISGQLRLPEAEAILEEVA